MRTIIFSLLVSALVLSGCYHKKEKLDSYDDRMNGIGVTGPTYADPPAAYLYQRVDVVCPHGTIVFWTPGTRWQYFHNEAVLMIPPGATLHLGILPDPGWETEPDIIEITYTGSNYRYFEWDLSQIVNG